MTLLALAASLCLAADPGVPPVLSPLGLRVTPAAEPPTIRVSVQLAGNDGRKQEAAVTQTAARHGATVAPAAQGKPTGPAYLQIVFPPAALEAQRNMLDQVIKELGSTGAGVLSGRAEELVPSLEERRAAVAAEATALSAEREALKAGLKNAPNTARLLDERLAQLSSFDPQREPRRVVLIVRLAAEESGVGMENGTFQMDNPPRRRIPEVPHK